MYLKNRLNNTKNYNEKSLFSSLHTVGYTFLPICTRTASLVQLPLGSIFITLIQDRDHISVQDSAA